jgi:hypothetical protein
LLAFGILEWTFLVVLVVLVGAAGLFGLYLLLQLFRNPSRRGASVVRRKGTA